MQKEQLSTPIENKTKIDTNTNNSNEQVYQALGKNENSNLDIPYENSQDCRSKKACRTRSDHASNTCKRNHI